MAVHPKAQKLLDVISEHNAPDYADLSPAQARELSESIRLPPGPQVRSRDLEMPGPGGPLPLRAYYPEGTGPFPVLIYYHGGGFVTGSIQTHDALCRQLCVDGACAVISVGYRLAPESKFPGPINDAYTALCWIHENADDIEVEHSLIALGGDSAGGTLATVTATLSKERRGPPIALQVLFYPVTELRSLDSASYRQFGEGHYLTARTMAWFRDHYLQNESQREDPRASPLAATNLIGLPPAVIITAECDVLCDDGEAYAKRLQEVGNPVELMRYDGMIHAFVSMYAHYDEGRAAIGQAGRALKQAFGRLA